MRGLDENRFTMQSAEYGVLGQKHASFVIFSPFMIDNINRYH